MDYASDWENFTVTAITLFSLKEDSVTYDAIKIIILVIACTGMITNIAVVFIFLNDKKMRRKIPNICIINQVCTLLNYF